MNAVYPASRSVLIVVAAALIDRNGRVLLAQRPPGKAFAGLWEFPGGKLEPGESPEAALVRELAEEIGVRLAPETLEPFGFASHPAEAAHLLMPLYVARRWEGEPRPLQVAAVAWAPPSELARYPMPPADRPLAARLAEKDWSACA